MYVYQFIKTNLYLALRKSLCFEKIKQNFIYIQIKQQNPTKREIFIQFCIFSFWILCCCCLVAENIKYKLLIMNGF